jgi:hypothetical protein
MNSFHARSRRSSGSREISSRVYSSICSFIVHPSTFEFVLPDTSSRRR